jgi:hypothetical protein
MRVTIAKVMPFADDENTSSHEYAPLRETPVVTAAQLH